MVLNNGGESDDPKSARQSPPKEAAEDAAPETPLFLPTDSQAVIESPQREDRPAEVIPPSSPVQSDTEEEEDESGIPPPPKNALPASQPAPRPPVAPYRRLTDIASSQGSLFTPRLSLPPALARKPIEKGALSQLYADEEEEDSDSDDSDDDSEKEGKSHVPKNRRAGSGVTRRTSGLLAFA
ncbi:hypothetical protein GLOTRDRAFT_110529 [Gloeophyllum trabeum ATCC 11539]|uniref:Uncharacterized protein n=1 Tax=Gloeophyllum trabeum (strain ATCC 11539 / FP-39264 / Madison 617) TaxID=670483 RepID=S7RRR7_GLOTA|nr:uncharacterized protein GLOTRDRAFT_110529 [Gloeophyllum trabeum ATCC 11539]EPQ57335.1 hypothetical protein GLOTRDRAFT_110529 [Gloeophyllum trabeum ATCC 11539]